MWTNQVLRNYMLNGVSVDQRMIAMEDRIDRRLSKYDADIIELRKDVDFFISSSLPPKEKVFVEGKMFDAQMELTRIVKTAKRRIVLVDNYIDERTLMLLGNRAAKVICTVYTHRPNSPKLDSAAYASLGYVGLRPRSGTSPTRSRSRRARFQRNSVRTCSSSS